MYKFSTIFNVKMLFVCKTEEGKSKSFFSIKINKWAQKVVESIATQRKEIGNTPIKIMKN